MEVVLASIPKESNILPTILGIHVTSLQSWCDALENSEPLKQLCVVLFRLLEKEYLTYAFIFEWTKWCLFSNFDYFLWDIFPIIATSQIIRSFFDVAMYIYRGFLRKRASLRISLFCVPLSSPLPKWPPNGFIFIERYRISFLEVAYKLFGMFLPSSLSLNCRSSLPRLIEHGSNVHKVIWIFFLFPFASMF